MFGLIETCRIRQLHIYIYMPPKKDRTTNDSFDPDAMYESLEAFATDRKCPFDWELTHYKEEKRDAAADRNGLDMYFPLLKTILGFARVG